MVRRIKDVLLLIIDGIHRRAHYDSIYREWYYKHSKRLIGFKNLHKGKDCFIIGNGPSLNKLDLRPLRDYYSFGLNKIYLMFDRIDLNLSYHVAVNPLVIEQSAKEFEVLPCPSFLSFRPARGKVRNLKNIFFIATGGPFVFQKDITGQIHEGGTVTYVAMQLAYYMGFKRIFLIGVDHNFTVSGKPNEQQFLTDADLNHFDSRYFAGKKWHLPDLEGSELAYHMAKFHFSRDNRKIFDATLDGKLQMFPKIKYEHALEICEKK